MANLINQLYFWELSKGLICFSSRLFGTNHHQSPFIILVFEIKVSLTRKCLSISNSMNSFSSSTFCTARIVEIATDLVFLGLYHWRSNKLTKSKWWCFFLLGNNAHNSCLTFCAACVTYNLLIVSLHELALGYFFPFNCDFDKLLHVILKSKPKCYWFL